MVAVGRVEKSTWNGGSAYENGSKTGALRETL